MSHFHTLMTAALLTASTLSVHAAGLGGAFEVKSPVPSVQSLPAAETRRGIKQLGGKLGGKITTTGVAELSAQDCKNVGGTVVTVTDSRCGASQKYCRMPDTNAVCIDILN